MPMEYPSVYERLFKDGRGEENNVKEYKIDTFVMGDDWKGKFDFLKEYCDVVYLPRTEGISTTKIKQDLGLKK